ncbi:unnamed protein product [Candida verbasci]|uniref:HTH CENPB-type domain-containing protein n=1 Tax=Candida verbasci TaxID=1227364 RepID=A0A9W4U216_9ASCO|nr:unnamed protein product [Candida verbasci]
MTSKLPRATLAQKLQVLDYFHRSERPQSETVEKFKNEISISTSSFSEWLKNENELRKRYSQADFKFSKNSKRKVKFKYEKINQAMDKLVKGRLERGEPITEPILREHWSIYAHQYGVDDPKRLYSFSHGWLSQFKKRHGINKKRKSQEEPQNEINDVPSPTDNNDFNEPPTNETNYDILQPQINRPEPQPQPTRPQLSPEIPRNQFKPQEGLSFSQNNVLAMNYRKQNQSPPNPQPFQPPNFNHIRRQENSGSASTTNEVILTERIPQPPPQPKQAPPNYDILQPTTAEEIEKFIFMFADRFFNSNQYEYPQTYKIFQELKDSFFNERFINNRNQSSNETFINRNQPTQEPKNSPPMRQSNLNQQLLSRQSAPTLPVPHKDHHRVDPHLQHNQQQLDEYFKMQASRKARFK